MIRYHEKAGYIESPGIAEADEFIAPAPRVSVQAFCETAETASTVQAAAEDRRLAKVHLRMQMGGIAAALEAYKTSPTPNVVILESEDRGTGILTGLDQLADVCDAGTRVIVIGRHNDVVFYRELIRRGISDYMIAPVTAIDVVRTVCSLFNAPDAKPVGKILAVVGAKGGVGASVVAHNIAWAVARDMHLDSVIADLDLPFGTAGLDYNQDPPQGIADAVFAPDRVDTAFVDRLLSKCTDHLSLLAAPATLDRVYDFGAEAFDPVLDVLRGAIPYVVLDVPHQWSAWTRRVLICADDILVVAAPDLANLRNAKSLIDLMRGSRPNDRRPLYCLNMVGVPKRPEIKPGRLCQGDRRRTAGHHPVRAADLRHGRQQWPDDRGDRVRPSGLRDLPIAGADSYRTRRLQAAAPRDTRAAHQVADASKRALTEASLFGKRSGSTTDLRGAPASPAPSFVPAQAAGAAPAAAPAAAVKTATGAALPKSGQTAVAAPPQQFEPSLDTRHSEIFYEVKTSIFAALIEAIDLSQLAKLDPVSSREEIRDIVNEIIAIKNIVMSISEQEELLDDICNDVLGYGPLEPVLGRDDVSDVMVNGATTVYVEIAGKIQRTGIRFRDNQQLLNICQRIVSQVGRRVDKSSPICDARLPDGSRVNVIAPPLSIDGPTLTIRKFKKDKLTLEQLVRFGTISPEGADVLKIIGRCRVNTIVSGGTGSGKTTLLNCLTRYIDTDERIITCEDAAELQLQQPHVVRLETRPPNLEGGGEVTMRELVRNCLRMRPERIIVGEVRGPEAFDLLQAMNTGHDGSMGTLHANNPREALSRLESMITMGGFTLPSRTIREMICASVDVVIQAARLRDASRRITHITEVLGLEGDVIITQDVFLYDLLGEDANGKLIGRHRSTGIGRPRFWDRARYFNEEKRLAAALDAALANSPT